MSIRYNDGEYNEAAGTRDAFGRFSDDLVAAGLPPVTVVSGDRAPQLQVSIFVARFRQQASGSGPHGDVRYWDGSAWGYPGGTRWVRWSSAGTVAVPGTGNHEKKRSNDLGWPYNAVTTAHLRAREIAARHNITCDGLGFGEAWHWTYWGGLGVIGTPAFDDNATPIKKDWFDMADANDLRIVVREEVAKEIRNTRTNEHFIVSYASSTDRNGIVLAGFGYWHKLTKEEWDHFNWLQSNNGLTIFAGLHIFTPINDRSYDILRDVCLQDGVAQGEGGLTYQEVLTIMESAPPAKIKALALDGTKPTVGLVDAQA